VCTVINSGADINIRDWFGRTPLHLAVLMREVVMIELLMEHGVNALLADDEGIRASRINGSRGAAPHTIDFRVWKYEHSQEKMAAMGARVL
jgi:ankyrin repeat protein